MRRAALGATILVVALLAATAATSLTAATAPSGIPPHVTRDARTDVAHIAQPVHPEIPVVVRLGDQPTPRAVSHGPSPWDSAVLVAAIIVALLGATSSDAPATTAVAGRSTAPVPVEDRQTAPRHSLTGAAAAVLLSLANDWSANDVSQRCRHRAGPAPLAR